MAGASPIVRMVLYGLCLVFGCVIAAGTGVTYSNFKNNVRRL